MKRSTRNALLAATGLAATTVAVPLGIRTYVRRSCRPFYARAHKLMAIPGLHSGFVPQDLFYLDTYQTWLFSGYMNDESASPLYTVHPNGASERLTVELPDGRLYNGHGAAVTAAGPWVYLTVPHGYAVVRAEDVALARDGSRLRAIAVVPLPLTPAFMIVQEGLLYAGEFYEPFFYNTPLSHHLRTPDGTHNPALMVAYEPSASEPFGFSRIPARCFSIPGKIQGMCLARQGTRMALSASWGFGDAHLLVYDTARLRDDDLYDLDGHSVPLTCLDSRSLAEKLTVPPMAEGVDGRDGQVVLANEAASERYLIGRFYGGGVVYELPV